MRIIGGEFRSRKLKAPPGIETTRPLPDRVRESVFNLLRGHFEGVAVVDAFAGTGSFGLEALSRGASRVVFVERDRGAARYLRENIEMLGVQDRAEVVQGDAVSMLTARRFPRDSHVVFFDPPYPFVKTHEGWARMREQLVRSLPLLDEGGWLMVRTPWPFWHLYDAEGRPVATPKDDNDPAEDERPARRGRGGRKRGGEAATERTPLRRSKRSDETPEARFDDAIPLNDARADAALDAFEAELAAAAIVRRPADLELPGAIGPETHPYKNTAVHLYQRDADAADSGA